MRAMSESRLSIGDTIAAIVLGEEFSRERLASDMLIEEVRGTLDLVPLLAEVPRPPACSISQTLRRRIACSISR